LSLTPIELTPQIIALQVPNPYDLAMLFCRAQEFYESPCRQFRGQSFSIWNYFRWYAQQYDGCFSYTRDFVGFNIPVRVLHQCYAANRTETPYDSLMRRIAQTYFNPGVPRYLIGVPSLKSAVFDHELSHAMYALDLRYRRAMNRLTATLPETKRAQFHVNLKKMGYTPAVFSDEIQAYLATGVTKKFVQNAGGVRRLQRMYRTVYRQMRPKFNTAV